METQLNMRRGIPFLHGKSKMYNMEKATLSMEKAKLNNMEKAKFLTWKRHKKKLHGEGVQFIKRHR